AGDTSAAANGAGIRIQDAVDASTDATILWNATSDKFEFSHGIISAGPITGSNLSGTNTGDETQASINALDITEVGTITSGVWNGSVITSAYLDADTAHLSGTQTFTGQKNFNSSGGTIPLNISRSGGSASQVLSIGVTDTSAVFNYIEDTSEEGTGAYGNYLFQVSGNEGTSPTVTALALDENVAKFAGTIYTRGATSLTPDATQPGAIILAKGGSEASPSTDGRGIEFLTADVNDGYGHRLVSFDNTGGDTPLILQRRNNNAAWTTQVTFEGNSNNTTFAGAISASNLSGTNTGDEPAASTTVAGIVELASITETNAGVSGTRAVTPAGLNGWTGSSNVTTLGTIATGTWNGTAIDATYLKNYTETSFSTTTSSGNIEILTFEDGPLHCILSNGTYYFEIKVAPRYGILSVETNFNDTADPSFNLDVIIVIEDTSSSPTVHSLCMAIYRNDTWTLLVNEKINSTVTTFTSPGAQPTVNGSTINFIGSAFEPAFSGQEDYGYNVISDAIFKSDVYLRGAVTGLPSASSSAAGVVTTGTQTFAGNKTFTGAIKAPAYKEEVGISSTTSGTFNIDVYDNSVLLLDTAMTANWTINVRGDSIFQNLNSVLAVGESITVVCLATQGVTPYYNSVMQINSVTQTVKWQGGTAPTAGNASSVDSYSYTIIKTASSTYTVLGNLTQFA
uniref:hypothetical protein n=1 Tax=Planktomarina sp. TaxID=2024851 RepID=UPI003260FC4D